jgi:hypothetical protein
MPENRRRSGTRALAPRVAWVILETHDASFAANLHDGISLVHLIEHPFEIGGSLTPLALKPRDASVNDPGNVVVARLPSVIMSNSGVGGHELSQVSDDVISAPALCEKLKGEIAQGVVQRLTMLDVLRELLVAFVPLAVAARCRIAKILEEEAYGVVNELTRIGLADMRQVFSLDAARVATVPRVRLSGFWMRAERDNLLPVRQQLDLLLLVAIGRGERDNDLLEQLLGAHRDRALRRLPETHEHTTAFLQTIPHQVLDRSGGFGVRDVDVERGCEPG